MRKQINNLRLIKGIDGMTRVYTPDGVVCLQEFARWKEAEVWALTLYDYLTPRVKQRRILRGHKGER